MTKLHKKYLIMGCGALLLFFIIMAITVFVKRGTSGEAVSTSSGLYKTTVDSIKDGKTERKGIDVSEHQHKIDWKTVKKGGEIDFAIVRVGYRGYTEGLIVEDAQFERNMKQTEKHGIYQGVYFFSQAVNEEEAKEEAQYVLDKIKDYDVEYPVVFDLEAIAGTSHRTYGMTPEECTAVAKAFCGVINDAGYEAMIYGNEVFLTNYYNMEELGDYELWFAQYAEEPSDTFAFRMWQYTESGLLDGIEGNVDFNWYYVR